MHTPIHDNSNQTPKISQTKIRSTRWDSTILPKIEDTNKMDDGKTPIASNNFDQTPFTPIGDNYK